MPGRTTSFSEADEERTNILSVCADNYEVGDEDEEWPCNILSKNIVAYESGFIGRAGAEATHTVFESELARCKALAGEARDIMDGTDVGMGSESGDGFSGFYVVTASDAAAVEKIDEALIRAHFAGTIFPLATITVEPLVEGGTWWSEVLQDLEDEDDDEVQEALSPWRELMAWFAAHDELHSAVFVRIGDYDELQELEDMPDGTEMVGSVFPRLAVALTSAGSLVGLFGQTVQS